MSAKKKALENPAWNGALQLILTQLQLPQLVEVPQLLRKMMSKSQHSHKARLQYTNNQ